MVKLMTATEAAELSLNRRQAFEKEVLEGPAFKAVVMKIEDAAQAGEHSIRIKFTKEDSEKYKFIDKVLKAAGYTTKLNQFAEYEHHAELKIQSLLIMW